MTTQKINELIQEIISNSESVKDFYEVEVSVLIRKKGGARSDFIRAQSHWTPDQIDILDKESIAHLKFFVVICRDAQSGRVVRENRYSEKFLLECRFPGRPNRREC